MRPLLITCTYNGTAPYSCAVATGVTEAGFCTNPIYNLYNNAANFTNGIAKNYLEYRIKKATIHVMLLSITCDGAAVGDFGTGLANFSFLTAASNTVS